MISKDDYHETHRRYGGKRRHITHRLPEIHSTDNPQLFTLALEILPDKLVTLPLLPTTSHTSQFNTMVSKVLFWGGFGKSQQTAMEYALPGY